MKKLKSSQKVRVIANGISFWSTVKAIRWGVGSNSNLNYALNIALDILSNDRMIPGLCPTGMAGSWGGYSIQLDIL